ncbi:D-aminoacylase [Vineibacter terrae]|uniref:N-acyl-D-amino-acid deacylase family protein n=1 Tax=Vineibacter terrae TaxID=2586908 RepID=UPI002E2FC2C9|nr:D-aminoacylase [Vineibacter terrae]HEX2890633.1 D-aminoacylase [Vineibacter terrae]
MPKDATTSSPAVTQCDLLLRDAQVIDGSGRPATRADIAVRGDRIVAMGRLDAADAACAIDASAYVAAPGFIDVHTHDDRALLSDGAMAAKTSQGVTTVVTGNCGVSLAPVMPQAALPMTFDLLGGRDWFRFADVDAYFASVEADPPAVNALCLVGHSTLRLAEMPALDRAALPAEIAAMQTRLAQAMRAGAVGISTGLYYPTSRAAPTEEVIALAKVAGSEGGIYATHMRDESDGVEDSIEETLRIGREGDVPVLISHHKVIGPQNFGRSIKTLARIEQAMRTQRVALDVYPYVAGSTVLDPQRCDGRMRVLITWSRPHPEVAGQDIADIARAWGCPPVEAAERLLPAGAIYFMLDEDDVRRILAFPHTMIGSDGLPHDHHPHPRLWGTFPRVLGHYARQLGLLTLEEAVRRMTSLPAQFLGLDDRGRLAPGAYADIVLFDPARIIDRATFDLPTAPSDGIAVVIVNGAIVWQDGQPTAARPGRVLRRTARIQPPAIG